MWYASDGGGDIKSVWMCERAYDPHESEKKLILVEFADSVVAYDCRWWKTPRGVVFTEPKEKYCHTAELGDASAVFKEGLHNWLVKQRGVWQWGGPFRTKKFNETDSEPMGEQAWVRVYGGWANVRVLVLWQPTDRLMLDWLLRDELPTDSLMLDELPTDWLMLADSRMETQ